MECHIRMRGKLLLHSMSDQMSFRAAIREKPGERVITLIHPAGSYEIAGNQQERCHFMRFGSCSCAAREQRLQTAAR